MKQLYSDLLDQPENELHQLDHTRLILWSISRIGNKFGRLLLLQTNSCDLHRFFMTFV